MRWRSSSHCSGERRPRRVRRREVCIRRLIAHAGIFRKGVVRRTLTVFHEAEGLSRWRRERRPGGKKGAAGVVAFRGHPPAARGVTQNTLYSTRLELLWSAQLPPAISSAGRAACPEEIMACVQPVGSRSCDSQSIPPNARFHPNKPGGWRLQRVPVDLTTCGHSVHGPRICPQRAADGCGHGLSPGLGRAAMEAGWWDGSTTRPPAARLAGLDHGGLRRAAGKPAAA